MVDDFYWLKRGTTFLDAGISSREEAASKLVTGTGWFWTVYTTVALVGVALADRDVSTWVSILIALPTLLLVVAYLYSLRAMMPFDGFFTPNDPKDIEAAYKNALAEKKRRLRDAFIATVGAAAAVLIATIATALSAPGRANEISTSIDRRGSSIDLLVDGQFEPHEEVTLLVTTTEASGTERLIAQDIGRASSTGELTEEMSFESDSEKGSIEVRWSDDQKREHSVSENIGW